MALTPMMQQYLNVKKEYPDCILFFRLGDFYEMFFDDAKLAAKELEIALTARGGGGPDKIPMCGVPHHSSDGYISKLVQRGYKVAICEQLEDPKDVKGIVKRDVVQVITPGTILEDKSDGENRYLISILYEQNAFALAAIDITTGELSLTSFEESQDDVFALLLDEIAKWQPKEVIVNQALYLEEELHQELTFRYGSMLTLFSSEEQNTESFLLERLPFLTKDHELFNYPLAMDALSALIGYIYRFSTQSLAHIQDIEWYTIEQWMGLDQNTRLHLDLQKNQFTMDQKHTLFSVLNRTKTAMGTRMLHRFIERPLLSIAQIEQRLDAVEVLKDDIQLRSKIAMFLDGIHDLDRLIAKLSYQKANARDLVTLALSLQNVQRLKEFLLNTPYEICQQFGDAISDTTDISEEILRAIVDEPPILITEGGMIREGYNIELDTRKDTSLRGQEALIAYEIDEKEKTGIKTLKIVFHKNKGYFIDVTKSQLSKVPDHYHRVQTLTNSERYRTIRLEEIEHMIFDSQEETKELEYAIFQDLREMVLSQVDKLQAISAIVARFDVFYSFAETANQNDYVRPTFRSDGQIEIKEGRHPVIETSMAKELFVHNDTAIGSEQNRIQVITGPNMAGKSTYMRQVALIVILAQIGSFVPAKAADLCIVDRIFTRIGASDFLPGGDSTFMVEMKEMAYILEHATPQSLLILDEIGRGTSTFDGMSIAWAIIEHIATKIKAKTLFATHYHELTVLSEQFENIQNMTVLVREDDKEITFLRKLVQGQSDKSYGIEVAKMAAFPKEIIARAEAILGTLEDDRAIPTVDVVSEPMEQLAFPIQDETREWESLLKEIKGLSIESMTPMDAMNYLYTMRKRLKGDNNGNTNS